MSLELIEARFGQRHTRQSELTDRQTNKTNIVFKIVLMKVIKEKMRERVRESILAAAI